MTTRARIDGARREAKSADDVATGRRDAKDLDMSPTRASTKLATRARYAAIEEDADEEDAASFVDADDRMPFGRASDFPPSYGEAKALKRVEGETSVSGEPSSEEEDFEAATPRDELGFEVPESLRETHEARRAVRADHRIRQMEYLEVYRNVPEKQRGVGGDACLALAVNGIHPDHRAEIWAEKLKAHVKQYSSSHSFYQYLELGQASLSDAERELIEGDVRAACPTHPLLRSDVAESTSRSTSSAFTHAFANTASEGFVLGGKGVAFQDFPRTLINILIAAAERSPHGYCSGFVVPAAVMLLLTEDEEASFWMLAGFTEDVLSNVISRSCINLYAEAKYIDLDVMLHEPELAAHFNEGDCRPSIVVAGLLTRVGLGVLPTESVLRLWDALILEGGQVLAPFSILVMKAAKEKLLAAAVGDLCETFDAEAARMHDVGDTLMDAIVASREMSSKFDSLSIRLGEREVTADVLNNLFNFRDVVRSLSESAGPEGIGRQEIITREELEELVCATYCLEQFADVDTAVDKKYQSRELLMAYDLAVRHKEELKTKGLRFDEFMKVLRVKSSTSSKLKMLAVKGDTVEARVKNFIIGETNDGMPTEKSVKLALFVANGVIPTQRLSSAPVESEILNRLASSENWYCEMRMNARAALILANFAIPLFISEGTAPNMERDDASDSKDAFDVSIIASRARSLDDSPRAFGGLVPLAHTEYYILVQTREGPPRLVKKRFSDFKSLHEQLRKSGCYNVTRVAENAIGTDAALSVDPHVVASRSVSLQRYLDQLNACGLPKVHRFLRAFLGLDEPKSRVSRLRSLCAACSPARIVCGFTGRARRR